MRTTVEIKDEQRARLQELAARRGLKGFSSILEEAIELYLQGMPAEEDRRKKALALRGALSTAEADRLLESTRLLRRSWR
jgi:predicted transcriptional regulator